MQPPVVPRRTAEAYVTTVIIISGVPFDKQI